MSNYYEILGVDQGAGNLEIKAAFRRLAMLYHPDKNPEERERFSVILKAYETLSDPALRRTYDYRIQHNLPQTDHTKKSTTKDWRFDEKELKRRKYYDEHIKKYAKPAGTSEQAEPKSSYNEFKYILFATPLAVILFLLVVKLTSSNTQEPDNNNKVTMAAATPATTKEEAPVSSPSNGDSPYADHFGEGRFETLKSKTLKVKNFTGMDIILCLFTKHDFVRSFYVQHDFSVEISQLPGDPLSIRYSSGQNFDKIFVLKEARLKGAFTRDQTFFRSENAASLRSQDELTLVPGVNPGFEQINEKDFFKKPY